MIDILVNDYIQVSAAGLYEQLQRMVDDRRKLCGQLFSEENIDSLEIRDLDTVFTCSLTGSYAVSYRSVVERYGYKSLVEHFKYFLYGSDPLEQRFDRFFLDIPEMPQLAVMEVAAFAQPRNFCIWDTAAKNTIRYIGHSRMHGLSEESFKDVITGLDYVWAKLALNHVRQILSAYSGRKIDYVDVYLFTKHVYEKWILKNSVVDG